MSNLENTDKYYKSKRTGSAFRQSAGDSVRKPGKPRKPGTSPVVTPAYNKDDLTTDKYYAAGGSKPGAGLTPPAGAKPSLALAGQTVNDLILVEISRAADVGVGVAAAKAHAARGGRVEIAVGEKELVAKVNVALDGAVSREELTADQRRAVRVGVRRAAPGGPPLLTPAAPAAFDPDAFLSLVPAAAATAPLDVDAFLAGGDDEDEKLAAIANTTPVGTTPPPEPADDNDFDLGEEPRALMDIKTALMSQPLLSPENGPVVGTTPSPKLLNGG